MSTPQKVSVIIPAYNHTRFLTRAVQSVLDQTYQGLEIMVVDDGSMDDIPEVVSGFDDPRIRYVRQGHNGLPAARNTGIRVSSGEYVAFLDADDWFMPGKLETQARFLDERPDVGMVAGGWIETDEYGRILRKSEPWRLKPHLEVTDCLVSAPLIVNAVLVRRYWLDAVDFFDESLNWAEDWDLWLRLLMEGCTLAWLPEIVCAYRQHGENMVRDVVGMRTGRFAVLEKFFGRPDLPKDVRTLENNAYALAHVDSAAREFGAGAVELARRDVREAIQLDPDLLTGSPCRLAQLLVGWSDTSAAGDRDKYLRIILRDLPALIPSGRSQMRKAVASHHMSKVFSGFRSGNRASVRASLFKAIRLDPTWLRNRGVLSIGLQTLLETNPKHLEQ